MPWRIFRNRDLVRTPWKNGGGTTAEVAVHPRAAGFDTFGWRISLADVGADGPFSRFPGIDRTLIVGEGRGIVLAVEGHRHRLDGPGALLAFAGDAATTGELIAGPMRDINVMTRRGQFRHAVSIAAGRRRAGIGGGWRAVVALDAGVVIEGLAEPIALDRLDTALFEAEAGASLLINGPAASIDIEHA